MSPSPRTDLLVVGAGPVGLATAIAAAGAGMSVRVLDPRDPGAGIDKACGEGLMPSAVAVLDSLGVHPAGRPFAGIAYTDALGRHRAEARFSHGEGLGVRRTELSRALAARSAELGVVHEHTSAADVVQDPSGVEVTDRAGRGFAARWVIAADGLHSPVRRLLEAGSPSAPTGPRTGPSPGRPSHRPARPPSPLPARYGLRRHYHLEPWSPLVEVTWAGDAEAYVTPVGDGVVGVAVLCGGGEPFEAWLRRFPVLARRLAGAEPAGDVRGCGPLRQVSRRRVHGNVLLAGDAAGYVDALTGEGLAVGLRGAVAAVDCLRAGRPQDYERAWTTITRRPRLLTEALVRATRRPPVRRLLVPAAAALPPVFRAAVRSLA